MRASSLLGAALIIALSMLFAVIADSGAQAADDTVYKTLDYRQLYRIMQDAGLKVHLRSNNNDDIEPYSDDETIVWTIGNNICAPVMARCP
jgi:hypothetical protein